MIWVDYVIIGIISLSALMSLFKGFVKEALSLVVWILSAWVSWTYFHQLSNYLVNWIEVPSVRLAAAFLIILISLLILGGLIVYLISFIVDKTGLSATDRIIGLVFGGLRGVLLVTLLVLLAGLTPIPEDPWWQQSILIGYFEALVIKLQLWLPTDIKNMFNYA